MNITSEIGKNITSGIKFETSLFVTANCNILEKYDIKYRSKI